MFNISLSHVRSMLNILASLLNSLSLTFTIFLYLSPIGHFDIADPSNTIQYNTLLTIPWWGFLVTT